MTTIISIVINKSGEEPTSDALRSRIEAALRQSMCVDDIDLIHIMAPAESRPCEHKSVEVIPGEPTIGPYYKCRGCGRQLQDWELP